MAMHACRTSPLLGRNSALPDEAPEAAVGFSLGHCGGHRRAGHARPLQDSLGTVARARRRPMRASQGCQRGCAGTRAGRIMSGTLAIWSSWRFARWLVRNHIQAHALHATIRYSTTPQLSRRPHQPLGVPTSCAPSATRFHTSAQMEREPKSKHDQLQTAAGCKQDTLIEDMQKCVCLLARDRRCPYHADNFTMHGHGQLPCRDDFHVRSDVHPAEGVRLKNRTFNVQMWCGPHTRRARWKCGATCMTGLLSDA